MEVAKSVEQRSVGAEIWMLAWGMLAIAAGLGYGRFAFAVLVPAMKRALGYGSSEIGWLGTSNLVGYTLGAATAGHAARLAGRKRATVAALLGVSATAALMGATTAYPVQIGLRLLGGVGSAWVLVLATSLVLSQAPPWRAGVFLGVLYAGGGLGIISSGLLLPPLTGLPGGWRLAWVALGALTAAVGVGYGAFVRPAEAGARPPPAESTSGRSGAAGRGVWSRTLANPSLLAVFAAYGLFGFGYIATSTFFVAYLRDDQGLSKATASLAWTLVGVGGLPGPLLFGRLRDAWGSRRSLVFAHVVLAASILLPTASASVPAALIGGLCFGATFVGLVTVVMAFVGELSPPGDVAHVIGGATVAASIGQVAGPAVAGMMADATGTLTSAFVLSALACLAGAPLVLLARRRPAARTVD